MTAIQPIIVTADLDRLAAFYTGLLGAEQTARVPDDGPAFYIGLTAGGAELGLVRDEAVAKSITLGSLQRFLLSVDTTALAGQPRVADLLERVTALGGQVAGPPSDMPWGQRVAHVQDPDGNTVNLTEPV